MILQRNRSNGGPAFGRLPVAPVEGKPMKREIGSMQVQLPDGRVGTFVEYVERGWRVRLEDGSELVVETAMVEESTVVRERGT